MQDREKGDRWRQWLQIPLWVSLVALAVSLFTCYDLNFRSDLDVVLGKQARLFVQENWQETSKAQPVVFVSLACVNNGGSSTTVTDAKMEVSAFRGNNLLFKSSYFALREVDNMLEAYGAFPQDPLRPIAVTGRSSQLHDIAFSTGSYISPNSIVDTFHIVLSLSVFNDGDWEDCGEYVSSSISDVWTDLNNGPIYKSKVIDITPVD